MKLYILYRKTSQYDINDIILGVFTDHKQANYAKLNYLNETKLKDPYYKQANYQPNLDKDVSIIEKEFTKQYYTNPQQIYIILSVASGMGQSYRTIEEIYDNTQDFYHGYKDFKKKREQWFKEKGWPFSYGLIQFEILPVNQLRFHNKTKLPHHLFPNDQ